MLYCPFTRKVVVKGRYQEIECNGLTRKIPMTIDAPCGKCLVCLYRRSQQWIMRLKATCDAYGYNALFVTLTYNNENLPTYISPVTGCVSPVLERLDLRNFIKRLRKNIAIKFGDEASKGIKYLAVGEYGSNTYRPHYHLLIFGLPNFGDNAPVKNKYCYGNELPNAHAFILRCWSPYEHEFGHVQVAPVTKGRIVYMSKYLTLSDCCPPEFLEHIYGMPELKRLCDEYKPFKPFMVCSKGIGIEWLTENMVNFIRTNEQLTYKDVSDKGDVFVKPIPSYLLKKIYSQEELENIRQRNSLRFEEMKNLLNHTAHKWWKKRGSVNGFRYEDYFDEHDKPRYTYVDEVYICCVDEYKKMLYRGFVSKLKSKEKKIKNYVEI